MSKLKEECMKIAKDHDMEVTWDDNWKDDFQTLLKFESICLNNPRKLSEEFIETFAKNEFQWRTSCQYQDMSISFLDRNIDKICIYYVLKYQTLNEQWIRRNINRIKPQDWETSKYYQNYSKSFIKEMEKYIYGRK